MAVITQAEARAYIPGLSADDAEVATLITRADGILAAWCGYEAATEGGIPTFEDVTYTRYLPGPGGRDLRLPVWPIVSVTTIEDDTDEVFDGTSYLVSSDDYSIKPRGIVRLDVSSTHGAWSKSDAEVIKAVWVAGFTTPPEDLKQIVAEYTGILWRIRPGVGARSLQTPQGSADVPDGAIPQSIRERLRRFDLTAARGYLP